MHFPPTRTFAVSAAQLQALQQQAAGAIGSVTAASTKSMATVWSRDPLATDEVMPMDWEEVPDRGVTGATAAQSMAIEQQAKSLALDVQDTRCQTAGCTRTVLNFHFQ